MKEFSVAHDKCAMRVNTDGCLLGAIAGEEQEVSEVKRILDIGTGSGVIALQMAQRFPKAFVDAVEIHGPSAKQAAENFKKNAWSHRMICYHEPLQEFDSGILYDVIVTNPPYFESGPTKSDEGVARARHALTLDFKSLLEHSSKLLREGGSFWCIIPADRQNQMIDAAIEEHLFPVKIYDIKPKEGKQANRVVLHLSKQANVDMMREELVLYAQNKVYTESSKRLLAPFYLSL